jgi:dephospho-CoA kinase
MVSLRGMGAAFIRAVLMLRVGLTGGIGSGKSTVAGYFAELGVDILDADVIARELLQIDAPAYKPVIEFFGDKILSASGEIDRKKLRQIIFEDSQAKQGLEKIIHPLVFEKILEKIKTLKSPYCIIVIPLLIETGIRNDFLDRICVVDAEESWQIKWASARDNTSAEDIIKIMKKQSSREERLRQADDIIYNNKDLQWLQSQVKNLHHQYLQISAS